MCEAPSRDSGIGVHVYQKKKKKKQEIQPRYATFAQRKIVLEKAKYQCGYCGRKLTMESANIDHVKPFIYGGKTKINNLWAACSSCNKRKGNLPSWIFVIRHTGGVYAKGLGRMIEKQYNAWKAQQLYLD
jgi:hypothetical protein